MSNDIPTRTPPKLPGELAGHAKLHDRKNSHMGGPATISLYGTPEEPHLYADTPDSFSGIGLVPLPDDLIRFAREILSFFGQDNGLTLPPWRPANDGTGQRPWFLVRDEGADLDLSIPLWDRFHYGANGNLVRFASRENAQRAADKLNEQEAAR